MGSRVSPRGSGPPSDKPRLNEMRPGHRNIKRKFQPWKARWKPIRRWRTGQLTRATVRRKRRGAPNPLADARISSLRSTAFARKQAAELLSGSVTPVILAERGEDAAELEMLQTKPSRFLYPNRNTLGNIRSVGSHLPGSACASRPATGYRMGGIAEKGGEAMATGKLSSGAKNRLLVGTAMVGVLCVGYGRRVYAGCALTLGTYHCSGNAASNTTTETLTGSPLNVVTDPGFGISVSPPPGDAFLLTSFGRGAVVHRR